MGVGRDGRHPGDREVKGCDVVPQLSTEGQDEAPEAAVHVETDAPIERERTEVADRIDGAVAVVTGRADERHGVLIDVVRHPVQVDQGRRGVDGRDAHLHPEEVTGLGKGRVRRLGFDHVRTPRRRPVLAVRQHRVRDRPRTARGHQPRRGRLGEGRGAQEVEGHGDDLGFELGGTRAHVALERVHVGEVGEGLVQVVVVVVVTAVHRPRALATLPGGVLGGGHRGQLVEHHLFRGALFGQCAVDGVAIRVGKPTHVCAPRFTVDGKRPVRARDTLRWNLMRPRRQSSLTTNHSLP